MKNKKELARLIAEQRKDAAKSPVVKVVDPADKAKRTVGKGHLRGRSTLKQQALLEKLGVPREKSVSMTKHAASATIRELLCE